MGGQIVTDEEFLKFVPHCTKCGEIVEPKPGEATIVVHRSQHMSDGRSLYGTGELYHKRCAPLAPNGTPYPDDTVVKL